MQPLQTAEHHVKKSVNSGRKDNVGKRRGTRGNEMGARSNSESPVDLEVGSDSKSIEVSRLEPAKASTHESNEPIQALLAV